MNIVLNGASIDVKEKELPNVLEELGYGNAIVATAVNGDFVAKSQRQTITLLDGDRLEVVAPMQGG